MGDVFDGSADIFESNNAIFSDTTDSFLRVKIIVLYILMITGLPANVLILYVSDRVHI